MDIKINKEIQSVNIKERNNEDKTVSKDDGVIKVVYRDERGRYYTSSPRLDNADRMPPPLKTSHKITSKTIGKTILPTSCQNYAARCITKTIGKIIWLREMLMLKGEVKVVPSKILILVQREIINQ